MYLLFDCRLIKHCLIYFRGLTEDGIETGNHFRAYTQAKLKIFHMVAHDFVATLAKCSFTFQSCSEVDPVEV